MSVVNGLSDAQQEALDLLKEECGELVQAASKCTRFGLAAMRDPSLGFTAGDMLHEEASDVIACLAILTTMGLIDRDRLNAGAELKLRRLYSDIESGDRRKVKFIGLDDLPT